MKKILVVEDDLSIRNQIVSKMKIINPSIEIYESSSGKEAYNIAMSHDISGFFFDIQIEDYSGIELAKRLRKNKKYKFIPMIFITAMPTRELEAFRQVHCYEYIIKPFVDEELIRVFEDVLLDFIVEEKVEKKLRLDFKEYTELVALDEIVCIERLNRALSIRTRHRQINKIRVPMYRLIERLDGRFIQIHQSVTINLDYLEVFNKSKKTIRLKDVKAPLPV